MHFYKLRLSRGTTGVLAADCRRGGAKGMGKAGRCKSEEKENPLSVAPTGTPGVLEYWGDTPSVSVTPSGTPGVLDNPIILVGGVHRPFPSLRSARRVFWVALWR